ncbi:hypothetical protein A0H81_02887 [Grifola frondosa]|uniref:Uncharacterized protein n=1 Tax=Grifola frondosa TaxID=5627 RepID=A0A1C7MNA6_GRIFR|nr:hypothetical protein A0H81_02887 [Grifola frondosa]
MGDIMLMEAVTCIVWEKKQLLSSTASGTGSAFHDGFGGAGSSSPSGVSRSGRHLRVRVYSGTSTNDQHVYGHLPNHLDTRD